MIYKKGFVASLVVAVSMICLAATAQDDSFKLVIMQDKKGAAQKYAPLADYLKTDSNKCYAYNNKDRL